MPAGPGSSPASSTRPGQPRSGSVAGRTRSACSGRRWTRRSPPAIASARRTRCTGWARPSLSPARRPSALEYGDRASALLRELGHRSLLYENEYILALALLQAGRIDEADALAEGAIEGCRAIGDRRNLAFALSTAAQTALPLLDLDRAEESSRQSVELAVALQAPRVEMVCRLFRAGVLIARGDTEGTEAEADVALRRFGTRTQFYGAQLVAVHGWVALRHGDVARADDCFARARAMEEVGMLTEMGAALTELLAWFDAADADRVASAGAWLRRAAGDEGVAMRGWADFADAAAATLRGGDAVGACRAGGRRRRGDGRSPACGARAGARVLSLRGDMVQTCRRGWRTGRAPSARPPAVSGSSSRTAT